MRTRPVVAAAIITGALAVLIGAMLLVVQPWQSEGPDTPRSDPAATAGAELPPPPILDETTHVLDDAGPNAPVVVEFLDFECEVCGAVYPTMEQLREQYEGEVTFAVRYFPMPGHVNAETAALAVEAAAEQGAFEEMYQLMFETQAEWGERRQSEAPRFREYAEQLGLDIPAFDEAVASPDTLARVEHDFQAGIALGVDRTPTIFIDDQRLDLRTLEDIEAGIVRALR